MDLGPDLGPVGKKINRFVCDLPPLPTKLDYSISYGEEGTFSKRAVVTEIIRRALPYQISGPSSPASSPASHSG